MHQRLTSQPPSTGFSPPASSNTWSHVLSALLLSGACAGPSVEGHVTPNVQGRVVFEGVVPEPNRVPIKDGAFGLSEFVSRLWLVGPESGLANCVISLHPLKGLEGPEAEPVAGAIFDKVGPYDQPQVLVVTCGTEVTLRNRESPCLGFMARCKKNRTFNRLVLEGTEYIWRPEHAEAVRVGCDKRPYTHGMIVVVDTPYYAKTDAEGRFSIEGLTPGLYRLRVFHEGLGYWIKNQQVEVPGTGDVSIELKAVFPPPKKGRRKR